MQMFRKPVKAARQGDRVGICVTNLDPTLIERGIATSLPSPMVLATSLICLVRKVRFFKQRCRSGSLFHVSLGHQTVTATAFFFGREELARRLKPATEEQEGWPGFGAGDGTVVTGLHQTSFPDLAFDWESDYEYQEELIAGGTYQRDEDSTGSAAALSFDYQESHSPLQWLSLVLQTPVYCSLGSLVIASKLDTSDGAPSSEGPPTQQQHGHQAAGACRLAFYGPVKTLVTATAERRPRLFRWKQRECEVQRLIDCRGGVCYEAIAWKLFHKSASIKPYLGLKLMSEAGEAVGVIAGPFGSSDKFRVKFPLGVSESSVAVGTKLFLRTKRFVFESKSRGTLLQTGIEIEGTDLRPPEALAGDRGLQEWGRGGLSLSHPSKREQVTEAVTSPPRLQTPPLDLAPLQIAINLPEAVPRTHSPSAAPVIPPAVLVPSSPVPSLTHAAPMQLLASIGVKKTLPPKRAATTFPPEPPLTPSAKLPTPAFPIAPPAAALQNLPNCDTGPLRVGTVESVKCADGSSSSDPDSSALVAVVAGCFRREENIRLFVGETASSSSISTPNGSLVPAQLLGPFAKLGKCKVQFVAPAPGLRLEEMVGAKVEIRLAA
jgi:hypothetical protein